MTPARVLVAYGSKNGATAEIAEAIADRLRADGLDADCRSAGDAGDVAGYDAVVLGSAVYMKRWRREARRFLRKHREALAARPVWIFSSGYIGTERSAEWEEPRGIVEAAERLGVREHVVFGGRVPADPGNFVERAMQRDTPPEQADQRDFDAIRAWASGIASAIGATRDEAAAGAPSPVR